MVIFHIYVSLQDGMMYIPCWVLCKTRWRVPTSVDGSLLNHNWGFIRAKNLQQWYIYIYWLVVLTILKKYEFVNGFRMTSHIWNGKKNKCLKPPSSICVGCGTTWSNGMAHWLFKEVPQMAKAVTSVWPWYLWLFNIQKVEKLQMKSDNFWWFTWFTYQTWWFS